MAGLRTDDEFFAFLKQHKQTTAVVEFGSTWCTKCVEFFPTWLHLSKKFSSLQYAVAQVDYMKEATKGIKYSPTFHVYRGGVLVDRVLGKDATRLHDHLWLHAD